MPQTSQKYDLEERTSLFSEEIIGFCQTIKRDYIVQNIVVQLVRSATSIGANYAEANGASSKKDFTNKIYICKKEARETEYWLRMLAAALPAKNDIVNELCQEAHELVLIFQKITSSLKISH